MDWFAELTGFAEGDGTRVRERLRVEDGRLHGCAQGRHPAVGRLSTPSLHELRLAGQAALPAVAGPLRVRLQQADVRELLGDARHAGALFQVASQFNLLEMVGPRVTPEQGLTIYQHDATQGPACAMAAGAATVYRHYFVPLGGQTGQTAARQLDMLDDLGRLLGNAGGVLWQMQNGYALCTAGGLRQIGQRLQAATPAERDALRAALRVGLHEDVEVTRGAHTGHRVTQLFGSALPVAYGGGPVAAWEPFARLVLEASYEATLWAGVAQAARTGRREVFLTLLGGGAFGNPLGWIVDALAHALAAVGAAGLDVRIVCFGRPPDELRALAR